MLFSAPTTTSTPTRWNTFVPSKLNRIENLRIPTRANLDSMVLDLHSTRCPISDSDLETEEHLPVKMCHC